MGLSWANENVWSSYPNVTEVGGQCRGLSLENPLALGILYLDKDKTPLMAPVVPPLACFVPATPALFQPSVHLLLPALGLQGPEVSLRYPGWMEEEGRGLC